MYVEDIDDLDELFYLEREALDRLTYTGSEQAKWDLEDIRERIKELGA